MPGTPRLAFLILALLAWPALASDPAPADGGAADTPAVAWPDPPQAASEAMPRAGQSLLLDAVRLGSGRVIAVGERGHVLVSDDDGGAWRQAATPTRSTLTAIGADGDALVAVGHDGVVLTSADAGETWQRVRDFDSAPDDEDATAPLLDVIALGGGRWLAIGAYRQMLESRDGGASWQAVTMAMADVAGAGDGDGAGPASAGDEADAVGEAGGEGGDDGSMVFSDEELMLGDEIDPHLNAVVRLDDGRLFVVGERGSLYRSDADGATWQSLSLPYGGSMFGVLALGGEHLLTFGLRGRAFESTDGGTSWQELDTGVPASLFAGAVDDAGHVTLVGAEGLVLRRAAGADAFEAATLVTETGETPALSALIARPGGLLLFGERGIVPWSPQP